MVGEPFVLGVNYWPRRKAMASSMRRALWWLMTDSPE